MRRRADIYSEDIAQVGLLARSIGPPFQVDSLEIIWHDRNTVYSRQLVDTHGLVVAQNLLLNFLVRFKVPLAHYRRVHLELLRFVVERHVRMLRLHSLPVLVVVDGCAHLDELTVGLVPERRQSASGSSLF